jgi:pimeloyl-ACP methyl ester carboxylesterase
MLKAADLDVERLGSGPRVVLVHGSIVGAQRSWRKQRELAKAWTLCLPNRPGFGTSPELTRGDFDQEAPLIAELLGDSAHLVGHSYGAVIALLAAARRPAAVRSLIVSEPGLLRLAAGDPIADAMIAQGEEMYRRGPEIEPRDFLLAFRSGVHSAHETPEQLPDWLERGARHAARERPPWHAEVPLDELSHTAFPKLVISGGHSPVFEAVCDRLAERLGGAERSIISGRQHTIPATGEPYNTRVHGFLARAERRGSEPARAERRGSEPARAERRGAEPARAEPRHPEPFSGGP